MKITLYAIFMVSGFLVVSIGGIFLMPGIFDALALSPEAMAEKMEKKLDACLMGDNNLGSGNGNLLPSNPASRKFLEYKCHEMYDFEPRPMNAFERNVVPMIMGIFMGCIFWLPFWIMFGPEFRRLDTVRRQRSD